MPHAIDDLLDGIRQAAGAEPFPLDDPVYRAAGRDPLAPILHAGSTSAPLAFLARDLGRDEVERGEPLVGQAGRLVRGGVARASGAGPEPTEAELAVALSRVLLTNTVPYKPPGNKAYAKKIRERFRPFLAAFLARVWTGDRVITLGNSAYEWFEPYTDPAAHAALWEDEDGRYRGAVEAVIAGEWLGERFEKRVRVEPLPHPSPANATWFARFPALLAARLEVTPR